MFRVPLDSCDLHRRKPRGALCLVRLTAFPERTVAIPSSARGSYTDRSTECSGVAALVRMMVSGIDLNSVETAIMNRECAGLVAIG
jgi:hypothetical protein